MDSILERCAGLEVHHETVVACILAGPLNPSPKPQTRTFETTTEELIELGQWLMDNERTHVVMESTGVYWKPVWNILEAYDFTLLLANAHHVKSLPGRKTDVNDAEWTRQIASLRSDRKQFCPIRGNTRVEDLTHYRKKLVHDT
ncbi:transposase [Heliobacterium chlorum]|uniref:Transposase n=1 Tax=Heliobacterium chlorum TaxID=2698 RepID=A0ABR7T563_HELCL|nr:transposase [Heliobacterium chlorum]MBC9784701.1 transposase [Heliobacterium chlorum]